MHRSGALTLFPPSGDTYGLPTSATTTGSTTFTICLAWEKTSCIAAKNKTLNPDDSIQWMDHGAVICSTPDKDN